MPEQNWKTPGYDPSRNGWWKASLGEEVSNFGYPHTYLFADSMRAIIQAFLKHFSNIWVCKYDEDGYPRKTFKFLLNLDRVQRHTIIARNLI